MSAPVGWLEPLAPGRPHPPAFLLHSSQGSVLAEKVCGWDLFLQHAAWRTDISLTLTGHLQNALGPIMSQAKLQHGIFPQQAWARACPMANSRDRGACQHQAALAGARRTPQVLPRSLQCGAMLPALPNSVETQRDNAC